MLTAAQVATVALLETLTVVQAAALVTVAQAVVLPKKMTAMALAALAALAGLPGLPGVGMTMHRPSPDPFSTSNKAYIPTRGTSKNV